MSDSPDGSFPKTVDEILTEADSRPGSIDAIMSGSIDSFVEFFEISGGHITSITSREVKR
jgi:ClpP class serine protease